jgi:hypothetical protein
MMQRAINEFDSKAAENSWKQMMGQFWSEDALKDKKKQNAAANAAAIKANKKSKPITWVDALSDEYRNAVKLLDEWYSNRATYWRSFTKHYSNFGSISSQAGESMNAAVKRRRSYMRLLDLVQIIQRVSTNQVLSQLLLAYRSRTRVPLSMTDELAAWCLPLKAKLTQFAVDKLSTELVAMKEAKYEITPIADLFLVSKSRGTHCIVKIDKEHDNLVTCDCGRMKSLGLMCRHAMIVLFNHQAKKITIGELADLCVNDANRRWYASELAASLNMENFALPAPVVPRPAAAKAPPSKVDRVETVPGRVDHVPETTKMLLIHLRQTFERCATQAKKRRTTAVAALEHLHELELRLKERNKQLDQQDCSSEPSTIDCDPSDELSAVFSPSTKPASEGSSEASKLKDPPNQPMKNKNPRTNGAQDERPPKKSKKESKRTELKNALATLSEQSQ